MTELPDHYEVLAIRCEATADEIEQAYQKRMAELRVSRMADAREEQQEVEDAYAVLRDPAARAQYDVAYRQRESAEDAKYAELDKSMPRHARKHVKGSSTGILDALWSLFGFLK